MIRTLNELKVVKIQLKKVVLEFHQGKVSCQQAADRIVIVHEQMDKLLLKLKEKIRAVQSNNTSLH
jgi:hypothetical protein